jgi:hypothetical protein
MANRQRDVAKERRWRALIARQRSSGFSVRVFCRRERLTESAYYFWRREIAQRDGGSPKRAELRRQAPTRPSFLPVCVTDPAPCEATITIELAGGRVLRLPTSLPAHRVAELVLALEAQSAAARSAR